ncbi:MAG TPA: hypothetical protein VFF73_03845 [Planctomycetota bacterium]|nr:hypothetical protein [Planctomycetota bacterium]
MKGRVLLLLVVTLPLLAQEDERPYERAGWNRRSAPLAAWTEGDAPDAPRPQAREATREEPPPPPMANSPGPTPIVTAAPGELFERAAGFERRARPRRAWTEGEKPLE